MVRAPILAANEENFDRLAGLLASARRCGPDRGEPLFSVVDGRVLMEAAG